MQYVQRSLQPFITVTNALTGVRPGSAAPAKKCGAAKSNSVRTTGWLAASASSSSLGSSGMLSGPSTKSMSGMRLSSASPSCWATQPATAIVSSGRSRLSSAMRPTSLRSFCSAFSRMLQVLSSTRSASASPSASRWPALRSTSPIRSESCEFIWQPKVMTENRAIGSVYRRHRQEPAAEGSTSRR
jgi:hypothetical protein